MQLSSINGFKFEDLASYYTIWSNYMILKKSVILKVYCSHKFCSVGNLGSEEKETLPQSMG